MGKQKKYTAERKLEMAIMQNSLKAVDDILSKKKHLQMLLQWKDDMGRTPAHWAAEQPGAVAIVSMLREFGFDTNCADNRGWTPLHCAAAVGELQTTAFLICSNADVAAQNKSGTTPLHLIVRFTPSDAVRQPYDDLLASMVAAAPSLVTVNQLGETPLHQAALRGNLSAMRILLDGGAPTDALTKMDETPLHYATRSGKLEAVSLLLGKGADATIMGKNGTALDVALTGNLQDCVELLSDSTGTENAEAGQYLKKLVQILRHPELCLVFYDFLAKRHSEENLSLWIAVEDYKSAAEEHMEEKAKTIVECYINPLSPQQVNLDAALVEDINNCEVFTQNTFDAAQGYVMTLMSTDLYPKFIQSTNYRNYSAGKLMTPTRVSSEREMLVNHFQRQRGSTGLRSSS